MMEPPSDVVVRLATREDMRQIHDMILELAAFEEMPDGPKLTMEDLISDGFDSSPAWFFSLVAERGGLAVGHALCNRAYSSWTRRAFYIEDLYVRPAHRSAGVGRAILERICQMCVSEGVTRIDWHVLESNAGALRFYRRLGARDLRASEGRAALRLDPPAIEMVARGQLLPDPVKTSEKLTTS